MSRLHKDKKASSMADESINSDDSTPPIATSVTTNVSSVVSDMTYSAPSTPARSVDTNTKQLVTVDKALAKAVPSAPLTHKQEERKQEERKQEFSKILDKIVGPKSMNVSALFVLGGTALVVLVAVAVLVWIQEQAKVEPPPPVEPVGLGGFLKNLVQKK